MHDSWGHIFSIFSYKLPLRNSSVFWGHTWSEVASFMTALLEKLELLDLKRFSYRPESGLRHGLRLLWIIHSSIFALGWERKGRDPALTASSKLLPKVISWKIENICWSSQRSEIGPGAGVAFLLLLLTFPSIQNSHLKLSATSAGLLQITY